MISEKTFIIAEAGVNHNGSLELAYKLIDAAKASGADAVKFQTFIAENISAKDTPKCEYQVRTTENSEAQFEMLKRLELSEDAHKKLINYCNNKKIEFLSSPFDLKSIDLLVKLGIETFKIPSGEIINLPYLRKISKVAKKIILSTGMSNMTEIERALKILTETGLTKKDIVVLHCNTEYPTPMEHVNLRAMLTIKKECGVEVGYSDHTSGIEVPIAAVSLGAKIIEKHLTLDKNMQGPDHKASLDPEEFGSLVRSIRNIELALGSLIKEPSPSEIKNLQIVRKSIVASKNIMKGDRLTEDNITVKRLGYGLSSDKWDNVINKTAHKNFSKDEAIEI